MGSTGIESVLEDFARFQKRFLPLFDNLARMAGLAKHAAQVRTPAFKAFIKEWGWLVNKKSIQFGDYCFGLYKRHGPGKFKATMTRWFSRKGNLKLVLDDLLAKCPARCGVIREGLAHHVKQNYACAITLLLPHIEGIIWDLGIERKLVRRGYASKRKHGTGKEWKFPDLSKKLFGNDKFHKLLVRDIFVEGFRNKILHGRNVYRGKQKEISRWRSTLAILSLWRLADEL
jgi:hypothetical protein